MFGLFGKGNKNFVDSQRIQKNLDILGSMIKQQKFKSIYFDQKSFQKKEFTDKFNMIYEGLQQWLNKISEEFLHSQNLVQLLEQSRTNDPISEQLKQRAKLQFSSFKDCDRITDLMLNTIDRCKRLNLIQLQLFASNLPIQSDSLTSVIKIIDQNRQNKQMIKTYKHLISKGVGQNLKDANNILIQQFNLMRTDFIYFKETQQIKVKKIIQQQKQINLSKQKHRELQKNIDDLNRQVAKCKSLISNPHTAKDIAESGLVKFKINLQSTNNQIISLKRECAALQSVGKKNQLIITKIINQKKQIQLENDKLVQQLNQSKQDYQKTKIQLADKVQSQAKFKIENNSLKDELKRASQKNQGLIEIIGDQQKCIKQFKKNMDFMNDQKHKYFTQLNQKYTLLVSQEQIIEELHKQTSKLRASVQELQKGASNLAKGQIEQQIKIQKNKQIGNIIQNEKAGEQMKIVNEKIIFLTLTNKEKQLKLKYFQERQKQYVQSIQSMQKLKDQLEQYKKGQYFDKQSWVCHGKETLLAAKYLLKEIAHMNNKQFKMSNLLQKYSPQDKLTWNHFSGKFNILIIIKTVTNKMIAVYTLAPLERPPNPPNAKQISFIYESDIIGNNQNYYYLLPDKKANGCYGNCVAFGKSDLRFTVGDDTLQGNFGYPGTYFDCKGKKISQLLGTNGGSKVKMVSYQIYSVILSQKKIEAKGQIMKGDEEIHSNAGYIKSEENKVYTNKLQQNDESKLSLQKQLDILRMGTLPQKQKIIAEANKEIAGLKSQIRQLKDENKSPLKQIEEKKQNIFEREKQAEQSVNFFYQKQMNFEQQNALNLIKIQNLQSKLLALKNESSTQKLVNELNSSQLLKSSFSQLQKTNQTLVQRTNINDIVCDYEKKLSDLMGQLQSLKDQMKCLSRQLSQLLNVCIKSKDEENNHDIFKNLEQIGEATINIQGLVGNFNIFVEKSNELKSNNRLTTFLKKVQQNLANLNEKCERVQELDYISCRSQVIKKLKFVCKPQNIIPFQQISAIEHENVTFNSFFNGLLEQH